MGVNSSYTADMVYARTIKRRSGNGINASLRNVSELMMASEGSSSQPPTVALEAHTEQQPSPSVVEGTSSSEPSPKADSEALASSDSAQLIHLETDAAAVADPDSTTIPSLEPHSGDTASTTGDDTEEEYASRHGCSNDNLNNNGGAEDTVVNINQFGDDAESTLERENGSGDPNRLNNNTISRDNPGLLVLGSSSSSSSTTNNNGNVQQNVRNNNHLNNILNNNNNGNIQLPTNTLLHQNNNWWSPPPVQPSPPSDSRNGSGKLSLLNNSAGTNGMKFSPGNGAQVAITTENGTAAAMLPKAILKCRPNSHPFQTRTLALIPNVEMKVGRAVARHPVSEGNAIFDCKVLSRNHAVLWYSDDKFYIRDTGSSNGTFVNNQRLSQTCLQSDKFEICSGDIVQFGVDVIENARKETHGCIVATVRLYLPDGRETKASQLTGVSAESGQVLAEDLYRMHQYIKEALLREQMLEVKMTEVQRLLEAARGGVNANWQAMVDEDRLLNRIDILEGKVHVFQKNYGEEKLRDEMRQMQDDKLDYQHAAKEALRRVHQDRYEAVQKLSGVELALRMTEDEAAVLRDKFIKSESTLNETMTRLSGVQQKHDELLGKFHELEAKLRAMEAEEQDRLAAAATDTGEKSLEQLIELERVAQQSIRQEEGEKESFGKAGGLMKLFANSDLRNLEGSADIINSICNSADDEDEDGVGEDEGSDYQEDDGRSVVERALSKEECATEKEKKKDDQLDTAEATEAVQGISCSKLLYKLQAVEKYLRELETGEKQAVMVDLRTVDERQKEAAEEEEEDNRSVAASTTSTLRSRRDPEIGGAVLANDMKQIVGQLSEICGEVSGTIRERISSTSEQDEKEVLLIRGKEEEVLASSRVLDLLEKVAELERENESLAGELQDRPAMSQLEAQVKLVDDLQLELLAGQLKVAELREKLEDSVRRYEELSEELRNVRCQPEKSVASGGSGGGDGNGQEREAEEKKRREDRERELDEQMLTNPIVEAEEELVLYKEKFVGLSEENIRLQREMVETRKKYEDVMQRSMVKLMMYMGPVVAILGYLVLWPYL